MTEPTVAIMLLIFAFTLVGNALLAFALWRQLKVPLFRDLMVFWILFLFSAVCQAVVNTPNTPMILAMSTVAPGYVVLCKLLSKLSSTPFSDRKVWISYALSFVPFGIAAASHLSFMWQSLPVALYLTIIYIITLTRTLRSEAARSSFAIRAMAVIVICSGINNLTYPFLRLNPSYALVGTGLSFLFILSFSVLAPATIIEEHRKRLLNEEHRSRQAAERAVKLRNQLLETAAHELRTPLTPLKMQIEIAKKVNKAVEIPEIPSKDFGRVLSTSDAQLSRLTRLADNLIEFSRLQEGPMSLERKETDLVPFVRNLIRQIESGVDPRRGKVRLESESSVTGAWDQRRLETAIDSLLMPVLTAVEPTELVVAISSSGKSATLRFDFPPSWAANAYIKKLPDTSPELELGLHLCHGIILAHRGSFRVDSSRTGGTSLTIELPRSA